MRTDVSVTMKLKCLLNHLQMQLSVFFSSSLTQHILKGFVCYGGRGGRERTSADASYLQFPSGLFDT